MQFKIFAIVFVILSVSMFANTGVDSFPPAMDKTAWSYLDSALFLSGASRMDTEFEKKWALDTLFRLSIVERILDKPLELPDTIDSWTRFLLKNPRNIAEIIYWGFARIDAKIDMKKAGDFRKEIDRKIKTDTTGSALSEPYRNSLRAILASFDIASTHISNMLSKTSDESLDSLLFLLPLFWTDDQDTLDDTLRCYFLNLIGSECDTSREIYLDSLYETMHKIKLTELGYATLAVAIGLTRAIEFIEADSGKSAPERPIEIRTRRGKAIIGTAGTDIYGDAGIILDPGGDDLYLGDHACGVIGKGGFGVVIDRAGNDNYDSRRSVFSQGCGVFGIGMLADLSGDDTYNTTHYGQGAGMFGSGLLIDFSGDDQYRGGTFVQGAGNFGFGALIDIYGYDNYSADASAQAFAGPKGIGIIADHGGSDNYHCGGKYLNPPLTPFDYHSYAQGFAIGWRPDVSGGIGFLFDRDGNDTYTCGVYGQGSSYWYSLGLLVDNAGNDVHNSVYYPQGSGIHLSIGALVDRGGDDIYISRFGPGQGAAHDWSVGFFSDYSGNDLYSIDGGNGVAINNSFALFVDRNGDDMFAKRKAQSENFGKGGASRGTSSLGIFLDIEGNDYYSRGTSADNENFWFIGDMGIGIDIKGEKFPDPVKELAKKLAEEEPDTPRTMEKIFREASAWAVGSAQDKANKAFQELLDSGEVSAKFICEKKLDAKSGLVIQTISNFCKKKKELMRPCLFDALHSDNRLRRGNAIYLFGEMADSTAVDSLLPLLENKKTRISVISALGKIKDSRAVPGILKWKKEERQSARYIIAKALGEIGDKKSIPTLVDFLGDKYMTVRYSAQFGLVGMSEDCFDTLLTLLGTKDITKKLHILWIIEDICAKTGSDTALDRNTKDARLAKARVAVLPLLDDKDERVRGHAVRALGTIGGEETKSDLKRRFELETDPFVRAMFSQVLKKD